MEQAKTFRELFKRLFFKEKLESVPVTDPQTGKSYDLMSEAIWDIVAAIFSFLYLLFMLVLFSLALFDIYHGQNRVLEFLFSKDMIYPDSPLCRLIAYAVIGGGLGGIINGFRSIIMWHSERNAFGWRFMWKYITLPPIGAVLAAMVYALVYGGIGVLGGDFTPDENSANQALSAFGIGALAGYGSQKVFKWLDYYVNRIFSTTQAEVKVPDLVGKTREEVVNALKAAGLKLGKEYKGTGDSTNKGTVIKQVPASDSTLTRGKAVDITIAE